MTEIKYGVLDCDKRVLSPVVSSELLTNWDTAIVDLHRNGGTFASYDVRLRNCSLHFNDTCSEYYVKYREVTFGMHDIYNMRTRLCECGYPHESAGNESGWKLVCSKCKKPKS